MENITAYKTIAQKYRDQGPLTAPKDENGNIHEAFISQLKLTYSPEEAEIIQHLSLPRTFTSSRDVAETSGKSLEYVEKILTDVHEKNGLMGMGDLYCLPSLPHLLNYHHSYPEIKPGDIEAGRLYQEYFIKDGFSKYYQSSEKGTSVLRAIPIDHTIEVEQKVLAAEEAHDFILNHSAEELALVPCPCRTRTEKLGIRECKDKFPIGTCIMMGAGALHFEQVGLGRRVTKQQAVDYFDEMVELGLVGTTGNANMGEYVICLCCGCCCSILRGKTRWDNPDAISPSNFVPEAGEDCLGCGACAEKCFFGALTLDEETDQIHVDMEKCIGCGLCTFACPQETLKLHRHERSVPHETVPALFETIYRENREG